MRWGGPATKRTRQHRAVGRDVDQTPAVAVPYPVAAAIRKPALVLARDDQIPTTSEGAIGQRHLDPRVLARQALDPSALVEVADQRTGRRKQDAVPSGRTIGRPCRVRLVGCRLEIADVDPPAVGIEAERRDVALTQRERGGRLRRVGEAVQVG